MAGEGFVVQNKWTLYYYSEQWNSNIFYPLSLAYNSTMFQFSPQNITKRYQHEKENTACGTFCPQKLRIPVHATRVGSALLFSFTKYWTHTASVKKKCECNIMYCLLQKCTNSVHQDAGANKFCTKVHHSLMFLPCIIRRTRNNRHYALICTTPLFCIINN
jgi:hypothetical protein